MTRDDRTMNTKGKFRIGYLVLILFFIYFAGTFISQQGLFNAGDRELALLEEKLAEEKRKNEELKKELEMTGTDEYIEKTAREKLGMVKRDERVFEDINK